MALTTAQQALCRQYLGWPFGFNDRSSHLAQSFSGLETKPDEEALVVATLASCEEISAKIVLAHNGSIEASNVSGGGAEFRLRLPLKRVRYHDV